MVGKVFHKLRKVKQGNLCDRILISTVGDSFQVRAWACVWVWWFPNHTTRSGQVSYSLQSASPTFINPNCSFVSAPTVPVTFPLSRGCMGPTHTQPMQCLTWLFFHLHIFSISNWLMPDACRSLLFCSLLFYSIWIQSNPIESHVMSAPLFWLGLA